MTAQQDPSESEQETPEEPESTTDEPSAEDEPALEPKATKASKPAQAEPEPKAAGSRKVWRGRAFGAAAAMLVAAIAATAVLQWVQAGRAEGQAATLSAERALRLEVSGAASAFGKALLSYDYQDLQTTRSSLMAQATGDFLATYDEAFGGVMEQVIIKLRAVSQATVREVYLSDVDEATAHAIVVVDQQVKTAEAIKTVRDSHLKISLVREKGTWKIHEVTVLGAAKEQETKLDGTPLATPTPTPTKKK